MSNSLRINKSSLEKMAANLDFVSGVVGGLSVTTSEARDAVKHDEIDQALDDFQDDWNAQTKAIENNLHQLALSWRRAAKALGDVDVTVALSAGRFGSNLGKIHPTGQHTSRSPAKGPPTPDLNGRG